MSSDEGEVSSSSRESRKNLVQSGVATFVGANRKAGEHQFHKVTEAVPLKQSEEQTRQMLHNQKISKLLERLVPSPSRSKSARAKPKSKKRP